MLTLNDIHKTGASGAIQRATFRLGVGFTSQLFSTLMKNLNKKTRVHALYIVLEVLTQCFSRMGCTEGIFPDEHTIFLAQPMRSEMDLLQRSYNLEPTLTRRIICKMNIDVFAQNLLSIPTRRWTEVGQAYVSGLLHRLIEKLMKNTNPATEYSTSNTCAPFRFPS